MFVLQHNQPAAFSKRLGGVLHAPWACNSASSRMGLVGVVPSTEYPFGSSLQAFWGLLSPAIPKIQFLGVTWREDSGS